MAQPKYQSLKNGRLALTTRNDKLMHGTDLQTTVTPVFRWSLIIEGLTPALTHPVSSGSNASVCGREHTR